MEDRLGTRKKRNFKTGFKKLKNIKMFEEFMSEKEFEKEVLSGYSNCCNAPVYGEGDVCSKCKEHCEVEAPEKKDKKNEGKMSEIDAIGQDAETREQFKKEVKKFLGDEAHDKSIADDEEAIDKMADTYFDEDGEKIS